MASNKGNNVKKSDNRLNNRNLVSENKLDKVSGGCIYPAPKNFPKELTWSSVDNPNKNNLLRDKLSSTIGSSLKDASINYK